MEMVYGQITNRQSPGHEVFVGGDFGAKVYPDGYVGYIPKAHAENLANAVEVIPAPGTVAEDEERKMIRRVRYVFTELPEPKKTAAKAKAGDDK